MKTLELTQGTPAWHQHRLAHYNASDAAAMMGASPYKSRTQLLRELSGAEAPQISPQQQEAFNRGHAAEAAARPKVEALIGEELYPAVGVSDAHPKLSASFDGITMDERTGYECKLYSEELAEQIRARALEPLYVWQLEQQALVAGLERIIFVAANEDASQFEHMEYRPDPKLQEQLIAGWKQLERDLAEFTPAPTAPVAVGRAPESLPALHIEVTGMVTASNLAEFKDHAIAVFRGINTDLQTDQDFADADKTVKWCGEIEKRLKAAKDHALSQTQSIDQLFRAIDEIGAEARAKRLELEKLVKVRKDAIKMEIVREGKTAYEAHEAALRAECGAWTMLPAPDFAGCIKNLRTVDSIRNAVQTTLANAKIKADESARTIRAALSALDEESKGNEHLFNDRLNFINMIPEAVRLMVRDRIAKHQEAEQARAAELAEKARARIREEEAARLRAEQDAQIPVKKQPEAPAAVLGHPPAPAPRAAVRGGRPSDAEIIDVLCAHFHADKPTVIRWLSGMKITHKEAA